MTDKRTLIISAQQVQAFSFTTDPDGAKSVVIHLDLSHEETGLAPGLGLAIRFSPEEARQIAGMLERKAREAEAASSRSN